MYSYKINKSKSTTTRWCGDLDQSFRGLSIRTSRKSVAFSLSQQQLFSIHLQNFIGKSAQSFPSYPVRTHRQTNKHYCIG